MEDNDGDGVSLNSIVKEFQCNRLNVKGVILLFLLILLVFSVPFMDTITSKFKGTVEPGGKLTTWGVIINAIILVFLYIIILLILESGWI
jgi:hypothetical protein